MGRGSPVMGAHRSGAVTTHIADVGASVI
jgi:hypothetical protein